MKIDLIEEYGDSAHINFAGDAKVSIFGEGEKPYFVKWFSSGGISETAGKYELTGEMTVGTGSWGSQGFSEVMQWKIEFWQDDKLIKIYENDLLNGNVIIVAKTKPSKVGKSIDFSAVKDYCSKVVNKYGCQLYVYFEESCSYDFSPLNFRPLRLNDNLEEMNYGIEMDF
ncbi:MAG TPA: hypothetical protein EYG21_03950 [Nitrospinaceae bacterium]|nr:hypothetical protein [Nitrospinaceae bacterium]